MIPAVRLQDELVDEERYRGEPDQGQVEGRRRHLPLPLSFCGISFGLTGPWSLELGGCAFCHKGGALPTLASTCFQQSAQTL